MPRSKKSLDERIGEKDEEILKMQERLNQIKAQKHDLEKRRKEDERKARTRRLIVIGGIAEKALGREFTDGDDKRFEKFLYGQEERGKFYTQAMNGVSVSQPQTRQYTADELFKAAEEGRLDEYK